MEDSKSPVEERAKTEYEYTKLFEKIHGPEKLIEMWRETGVLTDDE